MRLRATSRVLACLGVIVGCSEAGNVLRRDPPSTDAPPNPEEFTAVTAVSAGFLHTCALASRALYCWGTNDRGQLGVGDTRRRLEPAAIVQEPGWRSVVTGRLHTCALSAEASTRPRGSVWCWGDHRRGQLGPAVEDELSREPVLVTGLPQPVASLGGGFDHSCAILVDRSLWCWGNNYEGQLGRSDSSVDNPNEASLPAPIPEQVGTDRDWAQVDGGDGHTCGVRLDGSLWCWGRNGAGELGLGSDEPAHTRAPQRVGTDSDWHHVDAGMKHTCARKLDGSMFCWGLNLEGVLGRAVELMTEHHSPAPVAPGLAWQGFSTYAFHGCAVDDLGVLSCWGRNAEGQLGTGDIELEPTPVVSDTVTDVEVVSVGHFHTCVVRRDATLYCSGKAEDGQLGHGFLTRNNVFTRVSFEPPSE